MPTDQHDSTDQHDGDPVATSDTDRDGIGAAVGGTSTSIGADGTGATDLGLLLAGLVGGAGLIHLVMVPEHVGGGSWIDPVGFAVVGWLQIAFAVALVLRRGGRPLAVAAAVLNAAALGVWVWARTVGLPFGAHAGIVEDVGMIDGVCAGLEAAAVVVAVVMAIEPRRLRVGVLVPSIAAVAVLGLATVAISAPATAEHSHGSEVAAGGHDHTSTASDVAAHDVQMAKIDDRRCDLGFNPGAYWTEAAAIGIDTYAGGAMAMSPTGADVTDVVGADDGRGSAGLDRLVAATSVADSGAEGDAARLVVALSEATDEDYGAWRGWMAQRNAGSAAASGGGHAHASGSAAAPDDNGGHGGHAGPTPWKAMVDQEQCVTLAQELKVARDTALSMPTAADAMANGYVRVTGYVPGIAAHYMKFSIVDGTFAVDEPEMVLYDGGGPEARVVGLSYYVIQPGEAEPTQGFTGDNDHYHRHVGLCTGPGGVIGDSATTEAECAARGGAKANGSAGWMSHAWVVPGCESPWGLFSGASPLLDRALADASGSNDGGCSASGVRDRYDLRPGARTASSGGEGERADGGG